MLLPYIEQEARVPDGARRSRYATYNGLERGGRAAKSAHGRYNAGLRQQAEPRPSDTRTASQQLPEPRRYPPGGSEPVRRTYGPWDYMLATSDIEDRSTRREHARLGDTPASSRPAAAVTVHGCSARTAR